MAEQISDAKIKATEKEHSETFDSLFVNDGEKVRQVTKEKARELMGISGAETAIDKLNTDLASAVSEIQKNTEADAETKRKLDFLWKLNQGISYQYETDSASAYQKDIPGGAKCATVNKVGGKTVVWNQLANLNGTTSYSKEYSVEPLKFTGTIFSIETISGHKYLYVLGKETADKLRPDIGGNFPFVDASTLGTRYSTIITGTGVTSVLSLKNDNETDAISGTLYFNLIDLTIMFGAGNEPSTLAEFEAMFPADYYEYNAGTLMSAPVNEVVEQGKNLLQYPYLTTTTTKNGITFTDNGDGSISVKGTATSSTFFDLSNIRYHDSDFSLTATRTSYTVNDKTTSATGLVDGVGIVYNKDNKLTSISVNSGATVDTTVCVQIEKSSSATEYSAPFKNIYPIPESIMQLDGYGWGITDDVCNFVDWENKTFHQRVGSVDLGTLDYNYWGGGVFKVIQDIPNIKKASADTASDGAIGICSKYAVSGSYNAYYGKNGYIATGKSYTIITDTSYEDYALIKKSLSGVMLYYELATEIVTDISDIIGDTFQNPFTVEPGGTLTFKNQNGDDYRIPVPNEEEYLISLAEVTA